ncbi:MAG: magnesium chelatase ATPase subunit I [Alphaproteobacteria bacterium]|nr:magnesium chelatase ATPase subunit I [Alphaproteobacteria bacterium]
MPAQFPFSAIVGQDQLKSALLIAAVDPGVGGVMAFGDRGTGKSTAVRALAGLLPPIRVVKDCPYNCDPEADSSACAEGCPRKQRKSEPHSVLKPTPVVDMPLGATEDRVLGALDLERALTRGEKRFEPGLLAKAHRGFLYIDEINLLEDHLVDLLLDVAASGENIVEREGLSVRHPARFVLIGSGNPEEGELRPQLLDRFGLSVDVRTPTDLAERVSVVRQRDAFDRDPQGFVADWAKADAALRDKITRAQKSFRDVRVDDETLEKISALCAHAGVDGLRGELTILRAGRALAALGGKKAVSLAEVRAAAPMALQHRLRRNPLDSVGSAARVERAMDEVLTS